jgi:hypothetical protein
MKVTAQVTFVKEVEIEIPEELQGHLVGEGEQKWADNTLSDWLIDQIGKQVTCPEELNWASTSVVDENENLILDVS